MRQAPRYVTDQTGGDKLEISLPGGRYQLTLKDRAVNVLKDDLGLDVGDYVPDAFVPFFVAMGDAWFPRNNEKAHIISTYEVGGPLTEEARDVLISYVTNTRIHKQNVEGFESALKDSPIEADVDPDELQIIDIPTIPSGIDLTNVTVFTS